LNKQSGWKAITGTTDFKLITERADLSSASSTSSPEYRLAFDIFADRIYDYVGAYYLKLDAQVDALVFSGGIGERSKELREVVGKKVGCLGFASVDDDANRSVHGKEGVVLDIGAKGKEGDAETKRILVCRTDEQVSFRI
jgi:acetate kinase